MTILRVTVTNPEYGESSTMAIDESQVAGVRAAWARRGYSGFTVLGESPPAYSAAALRGEVMARAGPIVVSPMDGRAHVISEDVASGHSLKVGGMDQATQELRTENTSGDDLADEEDDYVEALYE